MEEINDDDFLHLVGMLDDYHGQERSSFPSTEAASQQTLLTTVITIATNNTVEEGENHNTSSHPTIQQEGPTPFEGFSHRSRLSDDDKKGITDWLLSKQVNGKLPYGGV